VTRRIPPLGTVIGGTAAVEQLGYELGLRGVCSPAALCRVGDERRARGILKRLHCESSKGIILLSGREELPPETDGLILLGGVGLPSGAQDLKRLRTTVRIPLEASDLSGTSAPAAEITVIDRSRIADKSTAEFARSTFALLTGEESNYPFPLRVPAAFSFSADTALVLGDEVLSELAGILRHDGVTAPFLITDRGLRDAGLLEKLIEALPAETDLQICDEVPPDSDYRLVMRLAERFRGQKRDAIIALGGGSVLDTAKGLMLSLGTGSDLILEWEGSNILPRLEVPFYAIPTTAGTGSESTRVAVISDHERHRKRLFVSPFLQPRAALLDSGLSASLPPYLTSITGMDALAHAMEAFTCLGKNPFSDLAAWRAVELISVHLKQAVLEPRESRHRLAMALASTLAGQAFSNSMVGMVHSIGHALGSVCGAPHGACMAVLLPHVLHFNLDFIAENVSELLVPLKDRESYDTTIESLRAPGVISIVRGLNHALREATGGRHPTRLREILGSDGDPLVRKEAFGDITSTALGDGSMIYNPREFGAGDILAILEESY
jgi:alcohol dehydrogenase